SPRSALFPYTTLFRSIDMGIEAYLLSSALVGVVAQRLVRTICPHCETKYFPSEAELADANLNDKVGRPFKKGGGCTKCHDTGFRSEEHTSELQSPYDL